jgi:hypothetical protein
MVLYRIAIVSAFVVSTTAGLAQTVGTEQGREIPAYTLPVPDDISPPNASAGGCTSGALEHPSQEHR